MTVPLLSIVVPAPRNIRGVDSALGALCEAASRVEAASEVILSGNDEGGVLQQTATAAGARFVPASARGFAAALLAGLAVARSEYVMTVLPDADGVGDVMRDLWAARDRAEVIVASRYIPGGRTTMSVPRVLASRALNKAFSRGLSVPVTDLSSAFRLYRAEVLHGQPLHASDYDLLPEMLVRALAGGWRVAEIPLRAGLARRDRAVAPLARLAAAYVRTFGSLWQLRNSIDAGDYDARAHDSIIPLQRYWQRMRFRHVTELIGGEGPVLDVGCGSSRIISALPAGSVALDILPNKLRYARRYSRPLVRASGFQLPFADAAFPCVLCSQVIEHVPMDSTILSELIRVLAPGGRLVLGTPDYARWQWVYMEKAYGFFKPGGYADEHISHYTRDGLLAHFAALGYRLEATRYILQGELILAFRKRPV